MGLGFRSFIDGVQGRVAVHGKQEVHLELPGIPGKAYYSQGAPIPGAERTFEAA
jgi:hypothetical protein